MAKKIFVISGFSGAGKDTLLKNVMQMNHGENSHKFYFSQSDTTRPPRNEFDTYNFISKDEFIKRASEGYYLESNFYGTGNYYGTPLQPVLSANESVIIMVDVNGMAQIKQNLALSNIPITTIFIAAPAKTLLHRLKNRGDNPDEIKIRLATAANEIKHINQYDVLLINDELEETSRKLLAILNENEIDNDCLDINSFIENVKLYIA